MSEIDKYEAQKKKLDNLCEEHDLVCSLKHDRYPITLTIKPLSGAGEQLSMLEAAEEKDYISPDASMVIYNKDGELAMKINGTFTISEALRNKFKNIYVKVSTYWLQYFFRDIMERSVLRKSQIPVIDEDEAEDDEDADVSDLDDGEVVTDPEVDAELYDKDLADDTLSGEDASTDDLIAAATQLVRMENKASMQLLARRLKIGYARACRIMTALKDSGIVSFDETVGRWEVLPHDVPTEG